MGEGERRGRLNGASREVAKRKWGARKCERASDEGNIMKQFVRRLGKDDRQLKLMARADQLKADLRRIESSKSEARAAQQSSNYVGHS